MEIGMVRFENHRHRYVLSKKIVELGNQNTQKREVIERVFPEEGVIDAMKGMRIDHPPLLRF